MTTWSLWPNGHPQSRTGGFCALLALGSLNKTVFTGKVPPLASVTWLVIDEERKLYAVRRFNHAVRHD